MKLFETLKSETEVYIYRRSDGSTFEEKQTFTELKLVPRNGKLFAK